MGTDFYLVCERCGSKVLHLGKSICVGRGKSGFVSNWAWYELSEMLRHYGKIKSMVVCDDRGKKCSIMEFMRKIDKVKPEDWRTVYEDSEDWS